MESENLTEILELPETKLVKLKVKPDGGIIYPKWSLPENHIPASELNWSEDSFALLLQSIQHNGKRLLVLDVDGKNGGYNTYDRLSFDEDTLIQKSRSGNGQHNFYWVDQNVGDLRCVNAFSGIDLLTSGLCICLPHQLNNNLPIKDAPERLVRKLLDYKKQKERRKALRMAPTAPEKETECNIWCNRPIPTGHRNNYIWAYIYHNKQHGDFAVHAQHMADRCGMEQRELDYMLTRV